LLGTIDKCKTPAKNVQIDAARAIISKYMFLFWEKGRKLFICGKIFDFLKYWIINIVLRLSHNDIDVGKFNLYRLNNP
jgi:hypothetical protein